MGFLQGVLISSNDDDKRWTVMWNINRPERAWKTFQEMLWDRSCCSSSVEFETLSLTSVFIGWLIFLWMLVNSKNTQKLVLVNCERHSFTMFLRVGALSAWLWLYHLRNINWTGETRGTLVYGYYFFFFPFFGTEVWSYFLGLVTNNLGIRSFSSALDHPL